MENKQKKCVAIIEDNEELSLLLTQIIETEGYHTRSYRSPQFIQTFNDEHIPDLYIVDAWLNGYKSGITQIQALFNGNFDQFPAVIVISGDESVEFEISNLPVVDFICKPFYIEELLTVMNQTLGEPQYASKSLEAIQLQKPLSVN